MSLSCIKTWNRNEILLSTDLNAEFNNILQNGSSLVFPSVTTWMWAANFYQHGLADT